MPFADLRVAGRLARRHPALCVLLVVILASGVAVATIAFSLVNVVWFRPLPYPAADRLVEIREAHPRLGEERAVARGTFERWRDGSRSLAGVEAYIPHTFAVRVPGRSPEAIPGVRVSPSLLTLLGVPPVAGRLPAVEDAARPGHLTAVLSARFVKDRFTGAAAAVGQTIRVDGRDAVVAGVMPADFRFFNSAWHVFLVLETDANTQPAALDVVARLRPGVGPTQAAAELDLLATRAEPGRAGDGEWRARLVPFADALYAEARPLYVLLLVSSGLLLLLVCANVSNLLLALAVDRQAEFAIRLSLGAGRSRLARQLLVEGMAAAVVGGAAALLACSWLRHLLVATFPEMSELQVDYRVWAFALTVSVLAGGACGILPVIGVLRGPLDWRLKAGSGWPGTGRFGLGRALTAVQVAAGCALLVASGLLVRSAFQIRAIDPGFPTDHLLLAAVSLPEATHGDSGHRASFYQEALDRLRRLPGVVSVAAATRVALDDGTARLRVEAEGRVGPPGGEALQGAVKATTADYFRTLGVGAVSDDGEFRAGAAGGRKVALVNPQMARALWGSTAAALGKRIRLDETEWREVVGLVPPIRQVLTRPVMPEVYVPLDENPPAAGWLLLRTRDDPMTIVPRLRATIHAIDPELPLLDIVSMEAVAASYFPAPIAAAFGGLGVVSAVLGALGLYGVTAFLVARRTRELGIRAALGAGPARLSRVVLRDGLRMTAAGLAVGIAAAVLMGVALSRQFYGVPAADPLVSAAVCIVMTVISLAACLVPARRAGRADPAVLLRAL